MTPVGLQIADAALRDAGRSADGLRELFPPLDHLLVRGGDPRLMLDLGSGRNDYGCSPRTSPECFSFGEVTGRSETDREIAARPCLIGQPACIDRNVEHPVAIQRLCLGARQVIEAWSPDARMARQSLERQIDRIAVVIAKIEMSLVHMRFAETSHGG